MSRQTQGLSCSGGNNLPQEMLSKVQSRIVVLRDLKVMLDADVADLYGVETKRVNEAVRNNPDKFPQDYMFVLTAGELQDLRSKKTTTKLSSKSRSLPKALLKRGFICWRQYLRASGQMK